MVAPVNETVQYNISKQNIAMTSVMDALADGLASNKRKHNATKGGKDQAATGQKGILTPEATPGPDEERNKADENRKQGDGGQFATTKGPDPVVDDGEGSADEETDVIRKVMSCGKEDYRKILGVQETYEDPYEEEKAILDALWDCGMEAHPTKSEDKDAPEAFKRILDAAKELGVEEEQIKELEEWEYSEDTDNDDMDGLQKEVPRPHKIIEKIYQEATPHFAQLQKTPKSKVAAKQLDALNDRIKKQNEKDEIEPSEQWQIHYQEFAEIYQKARPAIDRIRKEPNDTDAEKEIQEYSKTLEEIIHRHHYLNWNINLEVAAPEKPKAATRRGSNAPGPAELSPRAAKPAESTSANPEKPTNTSSAETQSNPKPSVSSQEAPARSGTAQQIQTETLKLWKNMGWTTHKMSDGGIIISHKALSKEGKEPYAFEFTVMTESSPYFQVKLGSEIGRGEMDTYLALPKIYKINTDPGNKDTPVYTYRNKANYKRLLFVVTKERKQTQAGKKPRAGDTRCGVEWKDGTVAEMSRAHFKKVTTDNELKAIEKYCKSVDVKTPWEMDPKTLTVSTESALGQQLLKAGRTGSAMNLNADAPKVEAVSADNGESVSSSLQSSVTALQTTLEAMDSKFEKNQMMMQEQLKKQQDLQTQMQQQMQQQQQQQMELQKQLMEVLGKLAGAPSTSS